MSPRQFFKIFTFILVIGCLALLTLLLSTSTLHPTYAQQSSAIESDDSQVLQIGTWNSLSVVDASGDSYLYSSGSSGDALTLEFEGTSVEIVYVTNPNFGDFAIEIDNSLHRTVVTASETTTYQNHAVVNYLEEGTHTLRVYSVSGVIAIDSFIANPTNSRIEAAQQEAAPTLTSPSGTITSPTSTFVWSDVAGTTWYHFYLTSPTGVILDAWYDKTNSILSCNGATCTVSPPVTLVNGSYTWYVAALVAGGNSDWSAPTNFTLDVPAPGAITKTAPAHQSTVTTTNVTFTWNHDPNTVWYNLAMGTTNTWYAAASVCTSTCTVNQTLSNGNYVWYVQPWGPGGLGSWGSPSSFTLEIPKPGIITKTAPIGTITDPTPDFSWQKDANSIWYHVVITTPSGSALYDLWYADSTVCTGGNCSISSPGTFVGAFKWYVHGWGPGGSGPWGSPTDFAFNVTLISPTSNIDGRNPTFTWSDLGAETTQYQIYVTPTDSSSYYLKTLQANAVCNGTNCSHSTGITLLSSKSYNWFIQPIGTYGSGAWSSPQGFGIDPVTPNPPSIAGCQILPNDNIWNTPIDTLPVDPNSSLYINTIGANKGLHMDFGSGVWPPGSNAPIGIPYTDVPSTQQTVPITFTYDDESDPGPYPIPTNAPIEGGPNATGDRHVIVLERDNCLLYEVFYAFPQNGGTSWTGGSGAIWDLTSNTIRGQLGWTSADAAGLPILPGLVTYEEVASGEINHAIRFTVPQTRNTYVWPATHQASSLSGVQYPPMGQRFRLKANFDISGYSQEAQVILQAMKTYGIILADNGSSWYISGAPSESWDNDILHEMDNVLGSNFEAVNVSSLMVNPLSGQIQSP